MYPYKNCWNKLLIGAKDKAKWKIRPSITKIKLYVKDVDILETGVTFTLTNSGVEV